MKKLSVLLFASVLLTACQESMEERCAREAREYTQQKCPAFINKVTRIDSLTFDVATHTISYCYSFIGAADVPGSVKEEEARLLLLNEVKNSTNLKAYRDEGYNIRYVYHSESRPGEVMYDVTFTKKDY
ncbi:MAG: hypothetical protein IJ527_01430 [Prevotella sp.]|nr:hypothetical protein [Prevotella sp.]